MHKRGLTLVEVVLLIAVVVVLFFFVQPFSRPREQAKRGACASSLRQIHTALTMYGQDYEGAFPMVPPGKGRVIGEDASENDLKPGQPENPWKDFPADHNPSISQNLWLLIRGDFAQPEIFTCPSSEQAGNKCQYQTHQAPQNENGPEYYVDFPWKDENGVMSYSFIQPWSKFSKEHTSKEMWRSDIDPKFVLAADANNRSQPDYKKDRFPIDYPDLKRYVNSNNHIGDGQLVLYGDGHVTFEKSPYCGMGGDNIFTARAPEYTGSPDQTAGILSVRPQDPFGPKAKQPPEWDTVLIPNKETELEKWDRKP